MQPAQWREERGTLRVAFLLSLLLAVPAIVQAERLPIRIYTTDDGLAHYRVRNVIRDSRDFLWICTSEGLSRFDGYRFTNYGMEHGLPSAMTNHVLETHRGLYWVATTDGVGRFNSSVAPPSGTAGHLGAGPRFTSYPVGNSPKSNFVYVLYENRAGTLWAGTRDGLFRWEETQSQGSFRRVEQGLLARPNCDVQAVLEDAEGSLWIGTSLGLIRRLPDGRTVEYDFRRLEAFLRPLLKDREGRLWIVHREGLIVFRPESAATAPTSGAFPWRVLTRKHASGGPQDRVLAPGEARLYSGGERIPPFVWSSCQTIDGRLWFASNSGLFAFDGTAFRKYTTAEGLSDELTNSVVEDRDGNLWVGTFRGGLVKIVRQGFTYAQPDGLPDAPISGVFADQTGAVCVTSDDWFISRFDGRGFVSVRPNPAAPIFAAGRDFSQHDLQDRAGEWWLPTRQGLWRFPQVERLTQLGRVRPRAVYTSRDGLPGDFISHVLEDKRGDIWISAWTADLIRWERATGIFHRHAAADGTPRFGNSNAFCLDATGNLWIGFDEDLARYASGRFRYWTSDDGLPAGAVNSLCLDRAHRLWVGTSLGGLGRIDDPGAQIPRFKTYSAADGLASNSVRCVVEDAWGRIYLGVGRGVDRLDPETGRIKHYTTADGLANSLVTAAFRDRQGYLWFGTTKGLSRLIPEPDRPQSPPSIWVGGLRIAGNLRNVSELGETEVSGSVLRPNQNQISIDFFGLGFGMGEALQYQYRLEGADDWSEPSDQRAVHYASLSPGEYRFMVRAINADGLPSATPATVGFTVLPPIWQRWWFLTLAAMLVGLMAYAIYRRRLARLLELEGVRTRIAADLHDDIGSRLSQIAILSEVARRQVEQGEALAACQLSLIARISRESVDAMSDIVWAINPQRDRLSDLTARMRRFASEIFPGREIDFHFDAFLPEQDLRLGVDARRQLFLIFKEGVHNMVRHSACTRADLEVRLDGGGLMMQLRDNGRGFDLGVAKQGHGLASMQRRAENLGGELQIASNNGQGTIVTLAVPPGHLNKLER